MPRPLGPETDALAVRYTAEQNTLDSMSFRLQYHNMYVSERCCYIRLSLHGTGISMRIHVVLSLSWLVVSG